MLSTTFLPLKLVLTLCVMQEPAPQVLELYNTLTQELVFPLITRGQTPQDFIVPYPLATIFCTDYVVDEFELEDFAYCEAKAAALNEEISLATGDLAGCEVSSPD